MLERLQPSPVAFVAFLWLAGCGSTTSVNTPSSPSDAGCDDAATVLDGGGVVEQPAAGGPACPSGACNYQTQDGCDATQACRPQFSAAASGVEPGCEAAGDGKSGAACKSGGDCAVGYFCVEQTCRKQCCGNDWTVCDDGESCFRPLQVKAGGVVTNSGMSLCFPVGGCDPLDPNACGKGSSCAIVDGRGSVACIPTSTAQVGAPCDSGGACAAGAICVSLSDGAECRALCRADACGSPGCGPGQGTCVHFNRDPAGVGECTPE